MTAKGSLTPDDSQSPVFPSSVALTSTPKPPGAAVLISQT
jgi:hypothetical protein